MTLSEARKQLMDLAATLPPEPAAQIAILVWDGMYRRKGVKRTPTKLITPRGVHARVRVLKKSQPNLSNLDIANVFNIGTARVSEALIGKRT